MGQSLSCSSRGAHLLVAAANGDVAAAQEMLRRNPRAALHSNFKDRSSPLIQAAGRGHFELLQLILETAVMVDGPDKAKRNCIDHTNAKCQTALMVACKNGHSDCVEYLVTNGADVLMVDQRRHNTCLHFAALYGHSECAHKLLSCQTGMRVNGRSIPIAQMPVPDEGEPHTVKFVDRHNGWGLTALHIAVFQGSVSTVRALLRHGANLEAVIVPSKVEHSPIRCAVGSNALHIAALIGNVVMAKLILEAQEGFPGLELRTRVDAAGLRPQEYAQRARNPVLVHLLDERLPVALLRQIWMNYSLEQSMPPRHQTLNAMLQKLKLMLSLEIIALQRALDALQQHVNAGAVAAVGGLGGSPRCTPSMPHTGRTARSQSRTAPGAASPASAETVAQLRHQYQRQVVDLETLLCTVTALHKGMAELSRSAQDSGSQEPGRHPTHEAVLDFILSTLITPRTVSAILHAAKKLVSSTVINAPAGGVVPAGGSPDAAAGAAGGLPALPPPIATDTEAQHGLALLTTAMRAVETCLQAASFLSTPGSAEAQHAAMLQMQHHQAAQHAQQMAQHEARVQAAIQLGAPIPAPPPIMLLPIPILQQQPQAQQADSASMAQERAGGAPEQAGGPGSGQAQPSLLPTTATPGTATAAPAPGTADAAGAGTQQLPPLPVLHLPHLPLPQDPASAAAVQLASALAASNASNVALPSGMAAAYIPAPLPQPPASGAAGASLQAPGAPGPGAAGVPFSSTPAGAAYASHWSAHLHTLIAQLQWDIGVQRHRRRRAHAAQQAARNAEQQRQQQGAEPATQLPAAEGPADGAGAADASPSFLSAPATPGSLATPGMGSRAPDQPPGQGLEEAHTPSVPIAPGTVTRSISSRRGDAVQEALSFTLRHSSSAAMAAAAAAGATTAVDTGSSRDLEASAAAALQEIVDAGDRELADEGEGEGESLEGSLSGRRGPRGAGHAGAQRHGRGAHPADANASLEAVADQDHPRQTAPSGSSKAKKSAGAGASALDGLDMDGGGAASAGEGDAVSEGSELCSDDEAGVCSICMDLPVAVLVASCHHGLCVQCAFQLTVKGRDLPCCPFCRQKIAGFELASKTEASPARGLAPQGLPWSESSGPATPGATSHGPLGSEAVSPV